MLTAAGDVSDRVEGLELGADDYLPKPFAFSELMARVRALGRRTGRRRCRRCWSAPGSSSTRTAARSSGTGKEIQLAPKEFAVLEVLMRSEGAVVSRRAAAGEGLGREHRPVHQRGPGDRHDPAPQARRAAGDRDRARLRLPDLTRGRQLRAPPQQRPRSRPGTPGGRAAFPWLRPTIRIRLTLLYGGMFLIAGHPAAVDHLHAGGAGLHDGSELPFKSSPAPGAAHQRPRPAAGSVSSPARPGSTRPCRTCIAAAAPARARRCCSAARCSPWWA